MSLVAYDSSDDSEEEIVSKPALSKNYDPAIKKQRECVKIIIPALKEFEEAESPVAVKKPKLQSGSGLFSLLPPPKNASTLSKPGFVPYVLSSKKGPPSLAPKQYETKFTKTERSHTSVPFTVSEEQDSDDEISYSNKKSFKENSSTPTNKDFFSLDELNSEDKINDKNYSSSDYLSTDNSSTPVQRGIVVQSACKLPSTSSTDSQSLLQNEANKNSYFQQYQLSQTDDINYMQEHSFEQQSYMHEDYSKTKLVTADSKESLLRDKEFLKIQGRQRGIEGVDIIDVNADDQLTDRNEWLMKSLTEESTHQPSRKKHNMPTQQQKRKHQITYLAFQAKEREMDLKNQWALNSRTRRETQAKYGF